MRVIRILVLTIIAVLIGAVPVLAVPVVDSFDGTTMEVPSVGRSVIEPASSELSARVLARSSRAGGSLEKAGVVLLVRSTGEEGVAPTDTDNDYTRIVDALAAAASLGDGTTIELLGTFDWTETHAFDDWAAGGYGPVAPTGLADITLTAQNLGDAVILGPGDPAGLNVYYEAFLFFFGGTYQGWTVSNLELRGFDWSLGFFFDSGGGSAEDFNGLSVVNNRIVMPRDVNGSVQPDEAFQNIGIHFAFGSNQLFQGNEIVIPGDSESNTATGELAASIAMQSNTGGGGTYDGLVITGNTVRVLSAPVIDPGNDVGAPFIAGIWENGGTNASNITVSDNRFVNDDPANDPADNLQRGFRLHSQASAASGKTVAYTGNTVLGAHFGLTWLEYSAAINYDDTSVPVEVMGNLVVDTATAVRVRSDDGDARATLRYNRVVDAAVGLEVDGGEADAENNWWGCNEGLDGGGSCPPSLLAAGTLDADPWLVLSALPNPPVVDVAATGHPLATLRVSSDGIDLGAIEVPESEVGFATDLGTITPLVATVDGTATADLQSTATGLARVTATLDHASATTTVLFTDTGVVPVRSVGATGDTPDAFDNDYTRINDVIQAVGDGVSVELEGTFDWTEPFADASWRKGSDGTASTADDYGIEAPAGFDNVTIRAATLGDAVIHGPGDLPGESFEGFLFLYGGTFHGWTVENLHIRGFDWSVAMFCCSGPGGLHQYDDVSVLGNLIEVPVDRSPHVAPDDSFQNVAIHLGFGDRQTISGNEIIMPGTGTSDTSDPDPASHSFAASVGLQSNTSGGAYEGLAITDNHLRITGAQSADPERIYGIWENGHAHTSNITVAGNLFLNEHADNDPALNRQRAFRITSHSSDTTTVLYQGNRVEGANIAFHWLGDGYDFEPPATVQPVEVVANVILGNGTGVFVHSDNGNTNARAHLAFNRLVGNGIGVRSDDAHVVAENNWWGCNEGPGTVDCDDTASTWTSVDPVPADLLDADPWLVAGLTLDPSTVEPGGATDVTVDLRNNSDGADTSGLGHLPDGTPTVLTTTAEGAFLSGVPATLGGVAEDVLTVDVRADIAGYTVNATIDQEMLSTGLIVPCPFDLQIANDTIGGTETFRAENVITLGPTLTVDGTSVEVIAGQRIEISSGTVIGGSFRAGIDPGACTP